jgi:hypothetical protein
MDLKAFKGLPHEFGGIDYTEGSEVEGGEFAVSIGKSGNEYIFDKNSSEGKKLSKDFKRLDMNGRLSEDDPLSLETFDQIAREEALKHAQRSVNEKGIDPFRNMYDEGGQAANGGVKYATGGAMMNPAEVANVNPGANYNTSMSYAPKTMEEHNRQTQGESRMRDSFGTQSMREAPTNKGFKEIGVAKEAGMLMGDIFLTPITSAFTGKSFSEMAMADMGYTSSDATKRAVGDDTMTGTAYGYGFAESEGVISNLGSSFFGKEGGAMPKDKYAQGGASGQKDMYMGGGMMQLFEGIHNVRQTSKQIAGPAIDANIADKLGSDYIRQPIAGPPTTSGQAIQMPKKKPGEEEERELVIPESGLDQEWMMDPNQTYAMPGPSDTTSMVGTDVPIDLGIGNSGGSFGSFGGFKNGGAKKGVYGYYANGGGFDGGNPTTGAELVEQMRFKRGVDTLNSGITYQDLQGGRSYPVYNDMGNEIQGRRNIGASSMSPGFDIQENFIPRKSTPQGYVPVNHDPYGNYDLNEESHFMHLRKPPRQSKLTRDLNAEQGFNLYADPVKNAPNVKSTSTLINNETGESYKFQNGGGKSYTDKIKDAERDFNKSLDYPMDRAKRAYSDEFYDNPRLAGDDMYLDPYRHGMAGYYTADAMRKKMPDWMPESVANKLAIAGSTIAGVGHEFASPSTERMGLVDALTEAGQDAYNNYVGAKMIEDVLFDREAKQLMLNKIKKEETYPGVVISDSDPYTEFDPKRFKNGGGKKKEEEVGVRDGDPPTKKIYKDINDYKIAKDAFVDSTNAYNYGLSFWDNNEIDSRNKMILYKDDPRTGSRHSDPAARHARYYNTDNYKAQPIGTNRIDLIDSDGTPAYQKPKTQPFYMPAPTGNYDNPDVRPVTEIKMPDGMWTKEKFINRYGEKVWNEQHPPKKLGNGGVLENKQSQDKTIDSFYPRKQALAMGSEMSYPYRTLQNPSYGDIRINTPKYQDGIIHPIHIEKRYGPSNIPNDSSMMYEDGGVHKDKDGGGKEKEEELLTGPTGAQGVIGAEGVIGPSTGYLTSNQVSSEDFASDPGMIPVRRDDTCVKGMNCFEDIAGMDIIPNWIVNNRDLEKFFNSPEGKEAYEQVSAIDAKAGDMVQFIRPVDVTNPKKGAREAASYALNYGGNPLNYPYHVGLMNSDSTYLGDGSAEFPVHEKSIYMDDDKRFNFESAGIFGDAAKFFMTDDNKKKANYYRLKDKEARQKQLDAAIKAKKDGVDISRQLYKNETPTGYVGNPYYNSRGSYPSAY